MPSPLHSSQRPALHIEAEPAGAVAAHLRFRQFRKELADAAERVGVGRRVRTRRAPDRALVDHDRLVHVLEPLDCRMLPGGQVLNALLRIQRADQNAVDERTFAGAGDAGHAGESPERNFDIGFFEVVQRGAADFQRFPVAGIALLRQRDFPAPGQIVAGQRTRKGRNFGRRAVCDEFAAAHTGSGAEVEHIVRPQDRIEVVLDHKHGVADVAQFFQRVEQPVVVALVQSDRRFVENVQDADQSAAELGRQPDPLRLAARKRARHPVQRQIVQPDVAQKGQAAPNLLQDGLRRSPRVRLRASGRRRTLSRLRPKAR